MPFSAIYKGLLRKPAKYGSSKSKAVKSTSKKGVEYSKAEKKARHLTRFAQEAEIIPKGDQISPKDMLNKAGAKKPLEKGKDISKSGNARKPSVIKSRNKAQYKARSQNRKRIK